MRRFDDRGPKAEARAIRERVREIKDAYDAGDFVRCAALCRSMLSPHRPVDVGVAVCFGKALLQTDRRCDEALPFLRRAARQCPREPEVIWADAQTFTAAALAASGEAEEAAEVLRGFAGAQLRSPASVGAQQGHAILAVTDDWRRGWALHEHRRHSPAVDVRDLERLPRWVPGERPTSVAVIDEQGLGDTVLAARWFPWLASAAECAPRFYGRSALRRWVEAAGCDFVERPVRGSSSRSAESSEIGESSVVLSMSLAHLSGCATPDDVPPPFAPAELLRAREQRKLHSGAADSRRRVGLCWTSSGGNLNKQLRFSAEQFAEVWAPLDGVEFVNLAHGARVGPNAPFSARQFADVYETGELIASLDMVVTVDTLIAHLAGSLGVPTVVIAPSYYDWRYRWPGEHGSPWYPSVSVIRQRSGDDVSVINRARANLVGGSAPLG